MHEQRIAFYKGPAGGWGALRSVTRDKLLGTLARAGRLSEPGFVVMSSRAGHELVRKCARLGIAALATISAPTATGVQVARLSGLRLWGLCRAPRGVLYATGPAAF